MIRLIFSVTLAVIITGCASSGRIGSLPDISASESSSKLVLIRVSSIVGAANSYYVALDGKDIFSIRSGEYTEFPIPAGEHFISVKCFGGWTPTWKESAKKFVASPDRANYFEISPNISCAEIVPITQTKAKKQLANSSFVSPKKESSKQ